MLFLFFKSQNFKTHKTKKKNWPQLEKIQDLGQYLYLMDFVSQNFKLEHHIGLKLD
jgi:hypothetical protein